MSESHSRGLYSVIIPTYNRAPFLNDVLQSLERQTYRPLQVVLVDDGSTDHTRDIVEGWQARAVHDEGLSIDYVFQENQGACAARNVGISHARGEYLQFVDSDDILFPYAAEWAVRRLTDRRAAYVYFKVHLSDSDLVPIAGSYLGEKSSGTSRDICAYLWHTMGAVYHAETVRKAGAWNEELTGSQDWEYAAKVKLLGLPFAFDPRVVGLFRNHSSARIGVARFNYHYVVSVEKACESILRHAEAAGKLDANIRRMLARRLLVHAVEFGANGFEQEKERLLRKSLALDSENGALQALVWGLGHVHSRRIASGCLRLNASRSWFRGAWKRDRTRFAAWPEDIHREAVSREPCFPHAL